MGIFRTIMRQQQRAVVARGCIMFIVFVFLVGASMMFGIPILVHLIMHGFKTHHKVP